MVEDAWEAFLQGVESQQLSRLGQSCFIWISRPKWAALLLSQKAQNAMVGQMMATDTVTCQSLLKELCLKFHK